MRKRIVYLFAVLFAVCTAGVAQNSVDGQSGADYDAKAKKIAMRMKTQLSLTDEQTEKVEALNKEYLPKMRQGRKRQVGCDSIGVGPKRNASCDSCPSCKMDCKKEGKKEHKMPHRKGKPGKGRVAPDDSRKAYVSELKKILTAEQYDKYKSMRKKRPAKRK